ncbi:MAG: translesion DNA synthesis-associated protein ImuA [Porticoccaceae bacterium]|nr:translesion DNA synthesis-associated protein ImuA [Porticoccaceae bacterium]
MPNKSSLKNLLSRQDTWRGRNRSLRKNIITTGNNSLDRLLLGGWPVSALTELVSQQDGIGELSILLPTLKHYADEGKLCVWLDPPYQPYAPALVNAEIPLDKLLVVRSKDSREWLWAAEQSIRGNALLFAWTNRAQPSYSALRKLQLAATESLAPAFLFSPPAAIKAHSPALLRIELESMKPNILSITLHKLRGKVPGAKIQISLGDVITERTFLDRLPVNINYPQGKKSDYPLPLKHKVQQLNT